MAATQGVTGKAGSITVGGTVVPITKWTAKVNVEQADSTDSGDYDSVSGNLYKAQLPGDVQMEVTIEGNYDKATTSTNVSSTIKNPANGPFAVVLKIDASTTYASGNFDFSDVETTLQVPGATMVSYSANCKSNGAYTISG